jgi:hypothetical protein
MKPELVRFTDGIYVIVGDHLTLEEAQNQFGREYDEEIDEDEPVTIDTVKHWWIRYEYIGPDNCPDDYDDLNLEPGDALWMLMTQTKRPKGVVRKATVINYGRN